jgi:hypothetical protein
MATSLEHDVAQSPPARIRRTHRRFRVLTLLTGLAPFVVAFAVYLLAFQVMDPATTGDEPHYLLAAESIAFDGDVDLTNDYASRERTLRVFSVFPLDHNLHAADYKDSGELRPLHGVGLPALLAPGIGLGGLTGARVVMLLIAALLALQLYRLLEDLGFGRWHRIPAWIAVAFCLPVLPFSSQIYPELPGALLVVVALRVLLRGSPSPAALALASTASAALIWFHVRYLPISFALLLGLVYVATSDGRRGVVSERTGGLRGRLRTAGADLRRRWRTAAKGWRTVTLPALVPYLVVLGLFILAFEHWYGSPDPRTPYYAYSTTTIGSGGWKALYDFILHDLFNPLVGWIPFVPVHWLGLAALGCLVVAFGWPAVAGIVVAGGYELILASAAPAGGWGLPARYLLIVIPLVAIPIALAIQQLRLARIVFVPLLAGSLVFAVAAVRDHQGLYPAGVKQKIFGLRSISPAFPVTRPAEPPTSFSVAPGQFPPQTGRLRGDRVVASAGRDKPGFVLYGPYVPLKDGAYRATFSLAVADARPDARVAAIEAVGQGEAFFARETLTGNDLRNRALKEVDLYFETPGDFAIEARVWYFGRGTLTAGPAQVEPLTPATTGPTTHLRDWPLAFLWIGGTILVGALFVQVMMLGRRRVDAPQ